MITSDYWFIQICRITALFAVVGSTVGLLTAIAFGVDGYNAFHGIWGYNSSLTAMAIGGFFVTLNVIVSILPIISRRQKRVAVAAILASVLTAVVQGCIAAM